MKEYTFDDFRINTCLPVKKENGRICSYSGKYDINYSSILSKLIQEAGRFCDYYASDLFIDWKNVEKTIETAAPIKETFLFGFRSNGVDHAAYVFSRYRLEGTHAKYNYRSLWRLDIDADGESINMTLGKVFSN